MVVLLLLSNLLENIKDLKVVVLLLLSNLLENIKDLKRSWINFKCIHKVRKQAIYMHELA